jgi:hypothetical protein
MQRSIWQQFFLQNLINAAATHPPKFLTSSSAAATYLQLLPLLFLFFSLLSKNAKFTNFSTIGKTRVSSEKRSEKCMTPEISFSSSAAASSSSASSSDCVFCINSKLSTTYTSSSLSEDLQNGYEKKKTHGSRDKEIARNCFAVTPNRGNGAPRFLAKLACDFITFGKLEGPLCKVPQTRHG